MGHATVWDSYLYQQSHCNLFQHFPLWEDCWLQILSKQRSPKALTTIIPNTSLEIQWRAGELSAQNFLTLAFRTAWSDGEATQPSIFLT